MANNYYVNVTLMGNEQEIGKVFRKLIWNKVKLGKLEKDIELIDDNRIELTVTGRRPYKQLLHLSLEYKTVNFYMSFYELEKGIMGEFECENFDVIRDNVEFSRKRLSEKEMKKLIEKMSKNKFLVSHCVSISGDASETNRVLSMLEELFIARLNPEWKENNQTNIEFNDKRNIHFHAKNLNFLEVLLEISRKYKDVVIKSNYNEVNWSYIGDFVCQNGDVKEHRIESEGVEYFC